MKDGDTLHQINCKAVLLYVGNILGGVYVYKQELGVLVAGALLRRRKNLST